MISLTSTITKNRFCNFKTVSGLKATSNVNFIRMQNNFKTNSSPIRFDWAWHGYITIPSDNYFGTISVDVVYFDPVFLTYLSSKMICIFGCKLFEKLYLPIGAKAAIDVVRSYFKVIKY